MIPLKTAPLFILILFIFTGMMTTCDINNDLDTEKLRLLNVDKQFAKMSLEKGAAEAFKHYLTKDAMGLSPGQHPVMGNEKLYNEMKVGQKNYTLAREPQRAEVAVSEDMGWTWGTYIMTVIDNKEQEQKHYGKYLNIWERQDDGQWRVIVDIGNSSPDPNE